MNYKFHLSHLYYILSFGLFFLMVLPPIMAHLEQDFLAEFLYNLNEPLCHQYIGRSYCLYNNWGVGDCDREGISANTTTKFNYYLNSRYSITSSKFDGEYVYNRNLVGVYRAERIDYEDGIYGYKLGVCARDTAIFLGILFAPLIYFLLIKIIKTTPHIFIAFLFLIPMAIDGFGQLFNFWESTNNMRFLTGIIAGLGIGYFLFSILMDINKKKKDEK